MKKESAIDIGLNVKVPEGVCSDRHCAFHGGLKVRGREFIGTVKKASAQKTAVVQWERLFLISGRQLRPIYNISMESFLFMAFCHLSHTFFSDHIYGRPSLKSMDIKFL